MKSNSMLIVLVLASLFTSCASKTSVGNEATPESGTKVYAYKDSCQHLVVNLSLELPSGTDSASVAIRDSLISDFVRFVQKPGYVEEGAPGIKPYTGSMDDVQGIVDYYGKADYDFLLKSAMSDYEQRIQYLDEDTTMTEEDKEYIRKDVPLWEFDFSTKKEADSLDIVMYYSQAYVYYGGAHGGIVGSGAMSFEKQTGRKIGRFIKEDATAALQPLLRKGLLRYYAECSDTITDQQLSERLQINGTLVPLPRNAAYLNSTYDSLVFVYGQYEIACYADGMPTFEIALKDLAPYLAPCKPLQKIMEKKK